MSKRREVWATGDIVRRHQSWRGTLVTAAVTLSEREWDKLTQVYAELWREAEDDLELRALTLEERIALFLSEKADKCFGAR